MTATTPAELQRLLAAEFDRQRWDYDLEIGRTLVEAIEQQGGVRGEALSRILPAAFFERSHTNRTAVARALERAVGGRTVASGEHSATITIIDKRYQVNLGPGSHIDNSSLNVGDGKQVNVQVDASKDTVLTALDALLRAGLAGNWDAEAADGLATVIGQRRDVDFEDVRRVTAEVMAAERPRQRRAKELLAKIATSGLGGALATGISAGAGELIPRLPL